MIASASQPRVVPSQRRIIERPRLLKLLDETDARTILLLAPAGYGKTTLARQWAKSLTGVASVRLNSSHRDFAVLADGLAEIFDVGDGQARRLIREHVRARTDAQRAASEIG